MRNVDSLEHMMPDDVGPGFFTADQQSWRDARQVVGRGEPMAGNMYATQVTQDKQGTCWVSDLEPTDDGWLTGGDTGPVDFGREFFHGGPL